MSTPEIDFDQWDESQDALEAEAMDADPQYAGLADTVEGRGYFPDCRDATPEPPAILDVPSVLRNRARVQRYLATGEWTWAA